VYRLCQRVPSVETAAADFDPMRLVTGSIRCVVLLLRRLPELVGARQCFAKTDAVPWVRQPVSVLRVCAGWRR
jgi:hypothetical protein